MKGFRTHTAIHHSKVSDALLTHISLFSHLPVAFVKLNAFGLLIPAIKL